MSEMIGNEEGISVWNKLGTTLDEYTQSYFNTLRENAQKYRKVYFSDVVEQRKKVLNNQKVFVLEYSVPLNRWEIQLFHKPGS